MFGRFSIRLFFPLVFVLVPVLIIFTTYIPTVIKEHAINTAVNSAKSTVKQYKFIRSYYNKYIVKKILSGQEFETHFIHKNKKRYIPLPVTFIHDISEELSSRDIITLKMYSPYPFPNRTAQKLDKFAKEAWKALNKNPEEVFFRMEVIDGKEIVRVAVADTLDSQVCVDCHNSNPDSLKIGWQLNDVRGVLEVLVPIDEQLDNVKNLNLTIIFTFFIAIGLLLFMFRKLV